MMQGNGLVPAPDQRAGGVSMGQVRRIARSRGLSWALDGLWLLALALYIFAGLDAVPFHGDEATLLFMSHDYYHLVQQRDFERVYYTDTPLDPSEQELRILNGTVPKMAMGLAWDLAGLTVHDLNNQWMWGFFDPQGEWDEWTWNHAFGHVPSDELLRAGRASSAVLLVLSAAALLAITRWIVPARWATWLATGLYVTHPGVLLNGRRSMMEGAMLLGMTLAILTALGLLRTQARPESSNRARWAWAAALGVAAGFALACKHTTLITVAIVFGVALVEPLVRRGSAGARFDAAHLARLVVAGALAIGVFLALNPAWWPDPLNMPERVLDARTRLIEGQRVGYGGYNTWGERVRGLVDQAFFAGNQYYEVAVWQEWIGGEIEAYEANGLLIGRPTGLVWGGLVAVAFACGLVALARRWWQGPALLALAWPLLTALALLIATPFEWQRYYLPLQPGIAVVAAAGVAWVVERIGERATDAAD